MMVKKEFYENFRKQPREYSLRLLIESKCDIDFKRLVGEGIMKVYELVYYKSIVEDPKEVFEDKDSSFLFFLDLVSVYVLDVPVMKRESDVDKHIDMLENEIFRQLIKSFISIKEKY